MSDLKQNELKSVMQNGFKYGQNKSVQTIESTAAKEKVQIQEIDTNVAKEAEQIKKVDTNVAKEEVQNEEVETNVAKEEEQNEEVETNVAKEEEQIEAVNITTDAKKDAENDWIKFKEDLKELVNMYNDHIEPYMIRMSTLTPGGEGADNYENCLLFREVNNLFVDVNVNTDDIPYVYLNVLMKLLDVLSTEDKAKVAGSVKIPYEFIRFIGYYCKFAKNSLSLESIDFVKDFDDSDIDRLIKVLGLIKNLGGGKLSKNSIMILKHEGETDYKQHVKSLISVQRHVTVITLVMIMLILDIIGLIPPVAIFDILTRCTPEVIIGLGNNYSMSINDTMKEAKNSFSKAVATEASLQIRRCIDGPDQPKDFKFPKIAFSEKPIVFDEVLNYNFSKRWNEQWKTRARNLQLITSEAQRKLMEEMEFKDSTEEFKNSTEEVKDTSKEEQKEEPLMTIMIRLIFANCTTVTLDSMIKEYKTNGSHEKTLLDQMEQYIRLLRYLIASEKDYSIQHELVWIVTVYHYVKEIIGGKIKNVNEMIASLYKSLLNDLQNYKDVFADDEKYTEYMDERRFVVESSVRGKTIRKVLPQSYTDLVVLLNTPLLYNHLNLQRTNILLDIDFKDLLKLGKAFRSLNILNNDSMNVIAYMLKHQKKTQLCDLLVQWSGVKTVYPNCTSLNVFKQLGSKQEVDEFMMLIIDGFGSNEQSIKKYVFDKIKLKIDIIPQLYKSINQYIGKRICKRALDSKWENTEDAKYILKYLPRAIDISQLCEDITTTYVSGVDNLRFCVNGSKEGTDFEYKFTATANNAGCQVISSGKTPYSMDGSTIGGYNHVEIVNTTYAEPPTTPTTPEGTEAVERTETNEPVERTVLSVDILDKTGKKWQEVISQNYRVLRKEFSLVEKNFKPETTQEERNEIIEQHTKQLAKFVKEPQKIEFKTLVTNVLIDFIIKCRIECLLEKFIPEFDVKEPIRKILLEKNIFKQLESIKAPNGISLISPTRDTVIELFTQYNDEFDKYYSQCSNIICNSGALEQIYNEVFANENGMKRFTMLFWGWLSISASKPIRIIARASDNSDYNDWVYNESIRLKMLNYKNRYSESPVLDIIGQIVSRPNEFNMILNLNRVDVLYQLLDDISKVVGIQISMKPIEIKHGTTDSLVVYKVNDMHGLSKVERDWVCMTYGYRSIDIQDVEFLLTDMDNTITIENEYIICKAGAPTIPIIKKTTSARNPCGIGKSTNYGHGTSIGKMPFEKDNSRIPTPPEDVDKSKGKGKGKGKGRGNNNGEGNSKPEKPPYTPAMLMTLQSLKDKQIGISVMSPAFFISEIMCGA